MGQTLLEAGLLLADLGQSEGADSLEQAGRLFARLRCSEGEAQTRLALGRCRGESWGSSPEFEQALALLLDPDYRQDLAGCAWYLLPWLLQSLAEAPRPLLRKALRLLAREFPRELERSLKRGALD